MLYEIINPSDPYTMEAESFIAALAAVVILGEGRYGLRPIDHEGVVVPPVIFGDLPSHVYQAAGVASAKELMTWLDATEANNEAAAKSLDSVRIGHKEDRERGKRAHDKQRSSANDIGGYAWKYAKALRGRRTFASLDVEAQPTQEVT